MTEPWNIIDSLQNWASILEEHIERLKIPKDKFQQHTNRSNSFGLFSFSPDKNNYEHVITL